MKNEILFSDACSGIGGARLGLEKASKRYRHVWSCDFDKYANWVYTTRWPRSLHYPSDIGGVNTKDIPDFDLLCAGFPCQPFSVSGKRKGLEDTRGTLFFEICRIAMAKRPTWILLENVKGLLSNDEGLTFQIILESLEELGYWVEWEVLNSLHFGVPQTRERVYIIGHLSGKCSTEIFPIPRTDRLANIEDERGLTEYSTAIDANYWKRPDKHGQRTLIAVETANRTANMKEGRFSDYSHALDTTGSKGVLQINQRRELTIKDYSSSVYCTMGGIQAPKVFDMKQIYREDELREFNGYSPTISTPSGGQRIPMILDLLNKYEFRFRRWTPLECERLQGFPDHWTDPLQDGYMSDTQRYKMLGNAMTVNVTEYLGKRMMEKIFNED